MPRDGIHTSSHIRDQRSGINLQFAQVNHSARQPRIQRDGRLTGQKGIDLGNADRQAIGFGVQSRVA